MSIKLDGSNGLIFPDNSVQASAAYLPYRNRIINGDMRIDQRNNGATVTIAAGASAYTLDRWFIYNSTNQTVTIQRGTINNYDGSDTRNCLKLWFSTAPTTGVVYITQKVEDVSTYAGQPVIFSAVIAGDATFNSSSLYLGQNFGSGGSSYVGPSVVTNFNPTGSLTRYSVTQTLPSVSGKTIGANNFLECTIGVLARGTSTIYVTDVQLEPGTVATPFERVDYSETLRRCQRYLPMLLAGAGSSYSLNAAQCSFSLSAPPRVAPTGVLVVSYPSISGLASAVVSNSITFAGGSLGAVLANVGSAANFATATGQGCAVYSGVVYGTGCEL